MHHNFCHNNNVIDYEWWGKIIKVDLYVSDYPCNSQSTILTSCNKICDKCRIVNKMSRVECLKFRLVHLILIQTLGVLEHHQTSSSLIHSLVKYKLELVFELLIKYLFLFSYIVKQ